MRILRISVITLYQHYFPTESERSFGEKMGRNCWGDGAMRVERYGVESDRAESGATKKEQKKRASKISLQSSLK